MPRYLFKQNSGGFSVKKIIPLILLLAALCTAALNADEPPRYAAGEAIVMMTGVPAAAEYRADSSSAMRTMASMAGSVADELGAAALHVYAPVEANVTKSSFTGKASLSAAESALPSEKQMLTVAHLKTLKGESTEELISRLNKLPNVISAVPNRMHKISAVSKMPDEAAVESLWGMQRIGAPAAWNKGTGSKDIIAVVMDTGVIYDHEDLKGNMYSISADLITKMKSAGYKSIDADFANSHGAWFHSVVTYNEKDGTYSTEPIDIVPVGSGDTAAAVSDDIDSKDRRRMSKVGDINGHGTHVAGTIGAVGNNKIGVAGVNWNVSIMSVSNFSKYYDPSLKSYGACEFDSDTMRAIDFVVAAKKAGADIRTVNMSFSGSYYGWREPVDQTKDPLALKHKELSDNGIIACIAAGNDGEDFDHPTQAGKLIYPSCYRFDNSITVGSTSDSNTGEARSPFSNYSSSAKWVDIFAPGGAILSTCRKQPIMGGIGETYKSSGYTAISGTSMAAPHVTGAAALLCSIYPNLSAGDIKAMLLLGANPYVAGKGFSAHGRLDLEGALYAFKPAYVTFENLAVLSSDKVFPVSAEILQSPDITAVISSSDLCQMDADLVLKPSVTASLCKDAKLLNTLPIFTASGNFGDKAAAVSMLISGCYLGSGVASELNVVKLITSGDKKATAFKRAQSASDYKDGYYAIFDEKTKQLVTETTFDSDTNYILTLFIKDNGEYDIDGAEGKIADPTVIYATAAPQRPSTGSSGCNAGFGIAALALLALLPMAARRGRKQ